MKADAAQAGRKGDSTKEMPSDIARALADGADLPRDFLAALFGRAAPEDLVHYSANELAALGKATFANLQNRVPGKPKIRVENPASATSARRLESITVIEVVNDDMPFLLDSVMGELTEQGVSLLLVVHPIFSVERNRDGKLASWNGEASPDKKGLRESVIQIHVERIDAEQAENIALALQSVLAEVRTCVSDWQEMRGRVHAAIENLKKNPPPLPSEEVAEAIAFLEWLAADNFTFLGTREYEFTDSADREMLEAVRDTGRGILRDGGLHVLRRGGKLVTTTPELREFLREPKALIITKANVRARVHRRVYMDYVGVKRFDARGRVVGEFRIVGLFTSTAYTRRAAVIPYLRRKIEKVLARARFDPASHSGKALVNVLENYPRDELFQIDEELLYRFSLEILQLEERPRVRVLARPDNSIASFRFSCSFRASDTTAMCERGSAAISRTHIRAGFLRFTLTSLTVRLRASTSSSVATKERHHLRSRASWKPPLNALCATGAISSFLSWLLPKSRPRRANSGVAIAMLFPQATAPLMRRRTPSRTFAFLNRCPRKIRSPLDCTAAKPGMRRTPI